jgi:glutamate formiminotransferase / 5-formyltetrahydrofolate cyclo-ligase
VIECVVNVSEGRDLGVVARLSAACRDHLLDVHHDPHHHRSVFTLVGEDAPRALTRLAVALLDLTGHDGVHPRLGVVDVVPFVPLAPTTMADAVAARDRYCTWVAGELAVPCFRYGPERTLPDVRRGAFRSIVPDCGPPEPHPSAGAVCAGARPLLVAYNVWLAGADLVIARRVAATVRRPGVRSLGLQVGNRVQVSMNLVDPDRVGPAQAYDAVAALAPVAGAELVGLVPESVLRAVPTARWAQLDLDGERTIEARLARLRR